MITPDTIHKYGYFENTGKDGQLPGVDIGLPIRFEKTSRFILGFIPIWPFTRYPFQTDKAIYLAKLNMEHPLQFVCGIEFAKIGLLHGTKLQIGKVMESDGGSIPVGLQPFIAKDSFSASFLHHDGAYIMNGLWMQLPTWPLWIFRKLTRIEADWLLYWMVLAEGGTLLCAKFIYNAVNLGGWAVWKKVNANTRSI